MKPMHARREVGAGQGRNPISWKLCLLVVLACWSPYIIGCLPGCNSSDWLAQVSGAMGWRPLTNHHPALLSLAYGGIYWVGMQFDGNQGGHMAVLMVQVATMACTVTAGAWWMDKMGVRRAAVLGTTAFFCLCPVFPMFAIWLVKNSLAAAFMYLFAVQLMVLMTCYERGGEEPDSRFLTWPALLAVCLLCCFSRNDSVLEVVPTLLVALLVCRRCAWAKRLLAIAAGGTVVAVLLWSLVAMPLAGITASNPREMLNMPLKQVAYVAKTDPESLQGEVGERLESLLKEGRDLESLAAGFRVRESDYVKAQFRFDDRDEVLEFLYIWAQVGTAHLKDYALVALATTWGYWDPFRDNKGYWEINDIKGLYRDCGVNSDTPVHFDGIEEVFPEAKAALAGFVDWVLATPGLRFLMIPAVYVWASLLLGIYLCVRRRPQGVLLVTCVCLVGICLLSPLNGSLRYALPLCFFVPLMAAFATVSPPERR